MTEITSPSTKKINALSSKNQVRYAKHRITINKATPKSHYTSIYNQECQVRFKGDKLPSAKEVYLYLLSLPYDWQIKVKNVSAHFDTSIKYMQQLFDIIISNDKMIALPLRNKSGKFDGICYQIFQFENALSEQPEVASRPPDRIEDKQFESLDISDISPEVVSRLPATYYKTNTIYKHNNVKKSQKNPPQKRPPSGKKSPPKFVVVDKNFETLKRSIENESLRNDFNAHTLTILKNEYLTIGQIKTLIDDVNKRSNIKTWGYYIKLAKSGVLNSIADKDIVETKTKKALKKTIARENSVSDNEKKYTNEINSKSDEYENKINSLSKIELEALANKVGVYSDHKNQLLRYSIRYKVQMILNRKKPQQIKIAPEPKLRPKKTKRIFVKTIVTKNGAVEISKTENSVLHEFRNVAGRVDRKTVFGSKSFLSFLNTQNIEMRMENDD